VYGPQIEQVAVREPLFVIGHWRSGTTFLHHLLAVDERFAYPNLWQALNPHTFLTTERLSSILRFVSPQTRLADNVRLRADAPVEDQIATTGSLRSWSLRWAFPRCAEKYDRYITFRGVPPEEIKQWQAALVRFYQKLTWKYQRPLLLKSPPHVCRIRLLLELFPDARFIHIYRNPYAVFHSTKRLITFASRTVRLQEPGDWDVDTWIIRRYQMVFDAFFEEREFIPPGRLVELRYEDLVQDPLGQLQQIYERLKLPDFAVVRPAVERYIASLSGYRTNTYAELPPAVRTTIAQAWRRNFEVWGYADE
jgi:hypothetical protein